MLPRPSIGHHFGSIHAGNTRPITKFFILVLYTAIELSLWHREQCSTNLEMSRKQSIKIEIGRTHFLRLCYGLMTFVATSSNFGPEMYVQCIKMVHGSLYIHNAV